MLKFSNAILPRKLSRYNIPFIKIIWKNIITMMHFPIKIFNGLKITENNKIHQAREFLINAYHT